MRSGGASSDTDATPFAVSVVIPLFNKEKSIAQTITSILRQSRLPDEIVIVDDGSTDSSVSVAKAALSAGPEIPSKILTQKNAGVSAARNSGAEAARMPFVAFLDGDDEWLPGYLAEVERLALAFPEATVLTTRNAVALADGSVTPEPSPLPPEFFGILERPLLRFSQGRGLIHSSSVTMRKDAFERSGHFPIGARQGEDIYVWLKLGLSEIIAHSGKPLSIFHVEHSEGEGRRTVVGHHFSYFLGTPEGRAYLSNEDLRAFLSSHLQRRIFFRRLEGHTEVQREHRKLAASLPLAPRLMSLLISFAPLWTLRRFLALHRQLRDLRRRGPRAPTAGELSEPLT